MIRRTAISRGTSAARTWISTRFKIDLADLKIGADHAAERLRPGIAGFGARTLVATRMVEDRQHADRNHSDSDLRDSRRASGWLHLYRRYQRRGLHHDRRSGDWRIHLRGSRQAHPN